MDVQKPVTSYQLPATSFTGYVLAGGKSSRMGKDKAALEIDGESFLKRAVEILRAVCGRRIKVIFNSDQKNFAQKISTDAGVIFDSFENRGAVGGIHAALEDCRTEFAVILAVDLPLVEKSAVEKLLEIALAEKDFAAIVPRQTDGRLQPLCAVYLVADCLPEIEKLLAGGESFAVRKFLDAIRVKIIEESFLSASRNIFLNINTPADYENLKTAE